MEAFFVSPHLVDAILGFTVVEAVMLFVWLRRKGAGSGRNLEQAGQGEDYQGDGRRQPVIETSRLILPIGLMLLPGICLMAAIRAALSGSVWPWMPAALGAALLAHLLDLRNRFGS